MKAKVIPVIIGATGTHFKITQTIPEQNIWQQEIEELQKNSHIGHRTRTTQSANVKVQNIFRGRNNITCSTDCKYRTALTIYTVETRFVSGTYF